MPQPDTSSSFPHLITLLNVAKGCMVDRLSDETEYVLIVLHQMRQEATADPQLFDRRALERIEEAIAFLQSGRVEVKAA